MPRGNAPQTKVVYKGSEEDFIVFVDSAADLQKWKSDCTIPLAQVVSGFKVFVTHKYVFPILRRDGGVGTSLMPGWLLRDYIKIGRVLRFCFCWTG
jgi:hypothetical protein